MDTLFPEETAITGFRLAYLEVYNWGGFHNHIWHIEPDCDSVLITGANGSGKTTLADALVTLLVPPVRRHYNQSSGSERKRDRTEESYVLGAFGNTRNDEAGRSDVSYLREKNCYSILIAVFRNSLTNSAFTLAQIRWFTPSGLQREYITADTAMSIEEHFHPLDARKEYRKRLQELPGIAWHESFAKYQQYLIRALGLRSEKALNLFSQIVGVKQIENLNAFIRTHMIEEPGMEEDFHKLSANYQDLLDTHNKIEMAEKQLELLAVVRESGLHYRKMREEADTLHSVREGIPFYFADQIRRTAEEINREQTTLLEKCETTIERMNREREELEGELESVNAAINQDSTSGRLQEIETGIANMQERMGERKGRHSQYLVYSEALDLPVPSSPEVFEQNRSAALEIINASNLKREELETELRHTERQQEDLTRSASTAESEIDSLKTRSSNIPRGNMEIRKRLCEALGAEPRELPFAGELVQVREEESRWELAAEKLLHGFALSILIPESRYREATAYINATDLKGRLIYYRIPENESSPRSGERNGLFQCNPSTLPAKLEVKPDTPYSAWLAEKLIDRFSYLCTDDLEEFSHADYAVTSRGLIKGKRRHEKDDRPGRWGRDRFVLGWDNRRKIAFLSEELQKTRLSLAEISTALEKLKAEAADERRKIEAGNGLRRFDQYSEIAWAECAERIASLESQKEALLANAEPLKALETKKRELQEYRKSLERIWEEQIAEKTRCRQKIESLEGQIRESSSILKRLTDDQQEQLDSIIPDIEKLFKKRKIDAADPIEGLKSSREEALQQVAVKIEEASDRINKAIRDLTNAMNRFLSPGNDISMRFPGWASDTLHLAANPDFLDDFFTVQDRINKDDLPRYKKDFRKFMNERMFENIIQFSSTLDETRRKIGEDIANLNRSLKLVIYSHIPPTYIALDLRPARDVAIQEFRSILKNSIGDMGKLGSYAAEADDELEASFRRIQELINRLSEDDVWRKKVLDVRNWHEFGAVERYRDTDEQKQYYEDSMSLSGGEKAKLAYTILASAVAYQYGLGREQHEQTGRSFRFIIVDEIFSKVDPQNSEYAMDLFKAMGLQLMIITPLDRINIVEKHIGSVCFIEKQKEYSIPHTLSMEEYRELQASRV